MLRIDLDILQQWIPVGGRVLDLGCGDGTLLCSLADNRQASGYGLEIDAEQITTCISRGVNVLQARVFGLIALLRMGNISTVFTH